MVGHGGSSAGSYFADPTSPIPSHCASIVATSTLRVNFSDLTGTDYHTAMCCHSSRTIETLTLEVLVATIDVQWEGMGDVGSARYKPALLPPCPTIRALSYNN